MKRRRPKPEQPPSRTRRRAAPATPADGLRTGDARAVLATREVFWQNVVREILSNLATLCAMRPALPQLGVAPAQPRPAEPVPTPPRASAAAAAALSAAGTPGVEAEDRFPDELFDGRLAVITNLGQRVPIADITPMLACGVDDPRHRSLAMAVECTVFQVRTPGGEVFTIPLREVRAVHALTPELMRKLERTARRQERQRREAGDDEDRVPFGFAAFTSLARGGPSIVPEAPEHPTE
ncbi:MAG: hypothetical protein WD749_06640 [Phycisphaerales bacterium]